MIIDVIGLIPDLITPILTDGVVSRAYKAGVFELRFWNPREYTTDRHHTVDSRPYGGGPGMVMLYEPLKKTLDEIESFRRSRGFRIYVSPQGDLLEQPLVRKFSELEHIVILCGRYEGIDQRLIDSEIDMELSIGNYVLSGGELAAAVIIDSVVRLLPGAISNESSHICDSFTEGDLLDHPHYARPREINGLKVPEVLFSGDHQKIAQWRRSVANERTKLRRERLSKA